MAKKILIVEDHPQICELIRLTLAPLDAEFFEAAAADDALRLAGEQKPDVIVLDVQLAGAVDGFAVCRAIRGRDDLTHCRVVIVTTQSQRSAVATGETLCADAYLTKPFSPTAMLLAVQQLLDS